MKYDTDILDREIGRNAQLFAQSVAALDTAETRYPYLRILVSLVEQAHPEWDDAPSKDQQIATLVQQMSEDALSTDEVAGVVRIRDAEQNAA